MNRIGFLLIFVLLIVAIACRTTDDSQEKITSEILYDQGIYTQPWVGIKQFGTTNQDYAAGVANDTTGDNFDVFVAGYSDTPDENENAFIVKYDFSGNQKWKIILASSLSEIAHGISVSRSGVYITGNTKGGLDENTNQGNNDLFLAGYNYNGDEQWIAQLGSAGDDIASDVFVDDDNNIWITGYTNGDLFTTKAAADVNDVIMIRYTTIGIMYPGNDNQIDTTSDDIARAIAVDTGNNKYIVGDTSGDMSYNLISNSSAGNLDSFLIKYNSFNSIQWIKQFGTSENDIAYDVAVDQEGGIYVVGTTWEDLDGAGSGSHSGGADIFLAKFDASGDQTWVQQIGTAVDDFGTSVAVDNSKNAYITGTTAGSLDNNIHAGDSDIFLIKYSSTGVKQWSIQFGTSLYDGSADISLDSEDNIYLTGITHGGLETNTNSGNADLFLVKFNTNGVKQ